MLFSENIMKKIGEIKSKYDLAAYCYCYLINTIENQIIFLGDYIGRNANAQSINPNFEKLNELSMQIKKIMTQNPFKPFSSNIAFHDLLDLIVLTEAGLKDYENASMNNATIPFFILMGLDLYFQDCIYEGYETSPLNNYCQESCLIYVNNSQSLMDAVINDKDYPEIIHTNEIRYCFEHIIILETQELPKGYGVPKMAVLSKEDKSIEKIVKANQIKIALIPAIQEQWFEFHKTNGASFEVRYDEQRTEKVKDRVVKLLKKAIECKVNIILFPEYVCKEEIQIEIGRVLAQINTSKPEKLEDLLFVAAGSGWTSDSNNVSCLYSYDGNLLGKVYKYSAFDNDIDGDRYVEGLYNPGKEITLVKVPNIGVFQTEICRNVSENEFCRKLSRVFNPQFLLITAWSASVNIGFKKQLDSIIAGNHRTCAALGNCCAAFRDSEKFRKNIGIIAVPQKNRSVVEGRCKYVERSEQKCDNCCEEGCIYKVLYDFNGSGKNDVGVKIYKKFLN